MIPGLNESAAYLHVIRKHRIKVSLCFAFVLFKEIFLSFNVFEVCFELRNNNKKMLFNCKIQLKIKHNVLEVYTKESLIKKNIRFNKNFINFFAA